MFIMDVCKAKRRMVKAVILISVLTALCLVYLTYFTDVVTWNSVASIINHRSQSTPSTRQNNIRTGSQRLTVCPGDVILEKTALSFPPCTDADTAADARTSDVSIQGGRVTYNEGDIISVSVLLHDRKGRQKTTGGDHLRGRIVGDGGNSIVTGTVFDHDNGSYTVQFDALFGGEVTVDVYLAYTREIITGFYRIRTEMSSTRDLKSRFMNGNISEVSDCHTFPEKIGSSELCNLTFDNSGMPWYCVKPKHPLLLCRDWRSVRTVGSPAPPYTPAENDLLTRTKESIKNKISISVKGRTQDELTKIPSLVPCSQYDTEKLWTRREPTGYLNKGKWELRHCKANHIPDLTKCLRGKSVVIFGDSTSRDWFFELTTRLNCNVALEPITTSKWHKHLLCFDTSHNVNASWMPHSQPFSVGVDWCDTRYTSYSISRYIDEEIKDGDQAVVVLHLFYHLISYRHDVLLTKLRRIRQSVERLLARNRFVKVLLKGPHTYKSPEYEVGKFDDYFAYLYWYLWFEAFKGLHDRIVYLDHKDITNAYKTQDVHPGREVISAMVDQLFAYVC